MKFNDDSCFSNTYNASVSGVDKDELLLLELAFLKLIDFRLYVSPDTFESYYRHLCETTERRALLFNCSWLDPSHSYKVTQKLEKMQEKRHSNTKWRKEENNLLENGTDHQVNSRKGLELKNDDISINSLPPTNDGSYSDEWKVLEKELMIACEKLNIGRSPTIVKSNNITQTARSNDTTKKINGSQHMYKVQRTENVIAYPTLSDFPSCKYEQASVKHKIYRPVPKLSF